ncbi:hypothetical protein BJX68DRAFT_277150 [Aspergillus pseudodeflectus]|uniref:BZIP domain-containing protein n=1 Tax=Aspergillus pseudodeflectus TaxID=176178 RepID=A0ABR4K1W6_9EURO
MTDNLSQTLSARCFLPTNQDRATKTLQSGRETSDGGKKRGRPRMAPAGDTTRMDRRAQIRYAQRTYRHKKELRQRHMEHRVAELEGTIGRVSDSLSEFFDMAIESDLHVTHPQLFDRLRETVTHLKRATGAAATTTTGTGERGDEGASREFILPVVFSANVSSGDAAPFGYMVNCLQDAAVADDRGPMQPFRRKTPSHRVERPLPGNTNYTYSPNEPSLLRTLQRYCLEYTYRLFSDARTDPREFYRVFRLVPCVKYREKMGKYLLCLVRSGTNERLDIPALPFYCIGGAGTHYPRVEGGKRVWNEKMRLPRRVLSTVASLLGEDVGSVDRGRLLEMAGLDGVWLDSNDVVGFLEERGVLGAEHRGDGVGVSMSLDLDRFLQALAKNMVILGRSPGFRLRDVEAALAGALRVDSM